MKYAQIVGSKVYSIFEHEQPLPVLKEKYFPPSVELIDITNDTRQIQEGWPVVDGVIIEPTPVQPDPEEIKRQQLAALEAVYEPQITEAQKNVFIAANVLKDSALQDELIVELNTLMDEYQQKQEAINNG